ncbi:MAG: hypothetical protein KF782_25780 [Labilithrix sp.]|nr:hypothetical protein [Labilithrix sp.]
MAATRLEPLILGGAASACALAARESELVRRAVQAEGGPEAPAFFTHVALLAPAAALAIAGILAVEALLAGGARPADDGSEARRRALLASVGPLASSARSRRTPWRSMSSMTSDAVWTVDPRASAQFWGLAGPGIASRGTTSPASSSR